MKKIIYMPFFLPFVLILIFTTKGEIDFTEHSTNPNPTEDPITRGGPDHDTSGREKDID